MRPAVDWSAFALYTLLRHGILFLLLGLGSRGKILFFLCLKTRPNIICIHFGSLWARKWWVLFVLFLSFLVYWSFFWVLTAFCNFSFFRLHLYHLYNSRIRRVQSRFQILLKILSSFTFQRLPTFQTLLFREKLLNPHNIPSLLPA